MSRWKSLLEEIPANPDRLLSLLAQLAQQGASPLPAVTLHMRTARDISGIILERREAERTEGATWVLQTASHERFPDDLTFVPVHHVDAVTLHGAAALGRLIEARKPAPTPLDLQRRGRDIETDLAAALGKPVKVEVELIEKGASENAARNAGLLVKRTATALKAIATDSLGKQALSALGRVRIQRGDALKAAKESDALIVSAPLGEEEPATSDQLKEALEAAL